MTQNKNSAKHAWMALVAVSLMTAVWTGVTGSTISLFAEPMIAELGITSTQFMLGATSIVALTNGSISMFLFGKIHSKLGLKKMMLLGGLIGTCGFTLYAFAQNFPMILAAGVMFGIGCCMNYITTLTLVINSWFKKRNATYMSIAQTVGSVTGIVAATVYSALIVNLGWRPAMLVTVAICGISTILIQLLYKGTPEELGESPLYADAPAEENTPQIQIEEDGISFAESLKCGRFYILLLLYVLVGAASCGPLFNLPLVVAGMGHGTLAGTIVSTCLITASLTLVPCGSLVDKAGSKWVVALGMGCGAIAYTILRGQPSTLMIYVAAILLGLTSNTAMLPCNISIRELLGTKDYAKKASLMTAAVLIGMAIGSPIMASFYDATGSYSTGFLVFSVLALVAAVLIFPMTKRVKS